jgi:putative ABC transport system permease protein
MPYALRSALRALAHRRALALTVVATLTLGIGANSAIFSAVDAILLKPLPYPDADRLVAVFESNAARRQSTALVAPVRLEEWNAMNHTFDGLAASYFENMTDTSGPLPQRVEAMRTSPRFFSVLRVDPALGRTFTSEEQRFGGPPAIVVSDAFWERRFNRDPSVLGRTLQLGGVARPIVGVMPPWFRYPTATTEVWIPTQAPPVLMEARQARFYTALGRLKPGVSLEQAQADLAVAYSALAKQYPQTDAGWSAALVPLKEQRVAGVRKSLWLLLAAVALVLLAACWNVACLMIADAARREHEIAVRFALGATRPAVVRQLVLEGLVLATAGATSGMLLARWIIDALKTLGAGLPRIDEIHVDGRLVAFTFAIGVGTTVLFALAPAVQATRAAVASGLRRGGRAQIGGRPWLQRLLVGAQVSLAIMLFVGAGLLVRSFSRLQHVSPGFDPDHVLTFRMSAQWSERVEAVMNRQIRTLARLEAIPGVLSASFATMPPASIDFPAGEFRIVGRDTSEHLFANGRSVSAKYFQTLRIPILQGETCRDDPSKPYQKILVTRAWAERFFPGENPIGHFIEPMSPAGLRQEIVGIAGDVHENGIAKEAPALAYTCGLQPYWPDPIFLVRTDPARDVTVTAIRDALRQIEPDRALYAVQPLNATLAQTLAQQRISALLLAAFAATGLLLAALGLYGVTSQFVASRRRDLGVRVALGAQPSAIVSTVAGQVMATTIVGAAVGVAAALALARFMEGLVFGISTRDPLTFLAAPVVLAIVAALATVIPARRAATVDPIATLREN